MQRINTFPSNIESLLHSLKSPIKQNCNSILSVAERLKETINNLFISNKISVAELEDISNHLKIQCFQICEPFYHSPLEDDLFPGFCDNSNNKIRDLTIKMLPKKPTHTYLSDEAELKSISLVFIKIREIDHFVRQLITSKKTTFSTPKVDIQEKVVCPKITKEVLALIQNAKMISKEYEKNSSFAASVELLVSVQVIYEMIQKNVNSLRLEDIEDSMRSLLRDIDSAIAISNTVLQSFPAHYINAKKEAQEASNHLHDALSIFTNALAFLTKSDPKRRAFALQNSVAHIRNHLIVIRNFIVQHPNSYFTQENVRSFSDTVKRPFVTFYETCSRISDSIDCVQPYTDIYNLLQQEINKLRVGFLNSGGTNTAFTMAIEYLESEIQIVLVRLKNIATTLAIPKQMTSGLTQELADSINRGLVLSKNCNDSIQAAELLAILHSIDESVEKNISAFNPDDLFHSANALKKSVETLLSYINRQIQSDLSLFQNPEKMDEAIEINEYLTDAVKTITKTVWCLTINDQKALVKHLNDSIFDFANLLQDIGNGIIKFNNKIFRDLDPELLQYDKIVRMATCLSTVAEENKTMFSSCIHSETISKYFQKLMEIISKQIEKIEKCCHNHNDSALIISLDGLISARNVFKTYIKELANKQDPKVSFEISPIQTLQPANKNIPLPVILPVKATPQIQSTTPSADENVFSSWDAFVEHQLNYLEKQISEKTS